MDSSHAALRPDLLLFRFLETLANSTIKKPSELLYAACLITMHQLAFLTRCLAPGSLPHP